MQHIPIEAITVFHSFACGYGAGAAWSYMALFSKGKKTAQGALSEFVQGITGIGLFFIGVVLPSLTLVYLATAASLNGVLAFVSWVSGLLLALVIGFFLLKKFPATPDCSRPAHYSSGAR